MNRLDITSLLIRATTIHQKKYLKILVLFVFFAFNFQFNPSVKSGEASLAAAQNLKQQSFVSKALTISGNAVVTIETERKVISSREGVFPPGILNDPYFERFFGLKGLQIPRSRIERGQGSGVIFSKKGLVLTNAHVIENTDQLIVGLSDGRRVIGKVVGQDSLTDLAVIQLKEKGPWPTAPLGDSDQLKVGDWAIAVGNPFGLENTVTLGIISNLNRDVAQLGISDKRIDLIQTDAAINPGNSGGPLLNSFGEVIGINTLVRTGPGAGLGFAIPINRARKIAKDLITTGRANHPMIGVTLSSNIKQKSNFLSQRENGAIIKYVTPNGPAEKGGLKINDLIISINNEKIKTPADVVEKINQNDLKSTLRIKIVRENAEYFKIIKPIDIYELEL
ncbi:trypsin-like peptidase domain-containing protein [Prochlorococcus marinus]|uniref:Serine protease n=1 Tax=Prochlorococcus marinus XMU1408 TaxID=2213228 RepID=A0A318RCN4_PROMR|nr:trypsin-like peptidase domain-containing protein [Prochlorococcus marinus]MBW3041150.1 serine protease [Prochlorococcus marinus str. XMU1408]PYE03748.1 serine protease [Prochlorococcus marinus XMU1408]